MKSPPHKVIGLIFDGWKIERETSPAVYANTTWPPYVECSRDSLTGYHSIKVCGRLVMLTHLNSEYIEIFTEGFRTQHMFQPINKMLKIYCTGHFLKHGNTPLLGNDWFICRENKTVKGSYSDQPC